ncbi:MAG: hypothetical protein ACREJ2_03885, partial [Planctomycetota bacterium]
PRLFPRLELPVGERTRQFLKNIDHAALAAWLDACAVDLSGRAAATGRAAPAAPGPSGVLLIAAADYARTALDLRHLLARHDPRKGPQAGRAPLALLLDDFACDQACQAQAGIRLGDHYPVYLLARGLPGAALDEQGRAPEALAAETLQRAEDLYHLAVGELGTERILFGTGLTAAAAPAEVAAQAATRAALAAWFRRPRAWLDSDSAELLFAANANRLAAC